MTTPEQAKKTKTLLYGLLVSTLVSAGPEPMVSEKTVNGCGVSIRPGDTMFEIASDYGVTVEQLQKANPNIVPERMHVGNVLTIPNCEAKYSGRGGLLFSQNPELLKSYADLVELSNEKLPDEEGYYKAAIPWEQDAQWAQKGLEMVIGFALDKDVPPGWLRQTLKRLSIVKADYDNGDPESEFNYSRPETGRILLAFGYQGTGSLSHELVHQLVYFENRFWNEGFAQYFSDEMIYGKGTFGVPFRGCEGLIRTENNYNTNYAQMTSQMQEFKNVLEKRATIEPKYNYIGTVTEIYARWATVHGRTPMPTNWFMSQIGQYYGLKSSEVSKISKTFPLFSCKE